jgi:hypothetical protein
VTELTSAAAELHQIMLTTKTLLTPPTQSDFIELGETIIDPKSASSYLIAISASNGCDSCSNSYNLIVQ